MRRNFEEYLLDRWNVLDVSALSLCLAAFVVRAVDYDSPGGGLFTRWPRRFCTGAFSSTPNSCLSRTL